MSMHSRARALGGLAANVYVSEGRSREVLARIEAAAGAPREHCSPDGVRCANVFVDEPYNRTGFTLTAESGRGEALAGALGSLAEAALRELDLRQHKASHPRTGAVDHVSVHPLGAAPLTEAAAVARAVGDRLGSFPAPVFLYGAAHPQSRELAAVRRALGYFRSSDKGEWTGASIGYEESLLTPDFGPSSPAPESGVVCIGAVPWVINFNLLLVPERDAEEADASFEAVRKIARTVSERGGGLPCVQAMALHHSEGIEVACNLLDTSRTGEQAVQELVEALAAAGGYRVRGAYRTNAAPEELLSSCLPNHFS